MALKDRLASDMKRVFLNFDHFAQEHSWNGKPLACVTDGEAAMKRKNNNVVDISWDNNTTEMMVYAPIAGFPGRVEPNEQVFFDGQYFRILQRQEDYGMYSILLVANEARRL